MLLGYNFIYAKKCPLWQWRSDGVAGRTGRHLLVAAKGRKTPKIKKKIHVKIKIVFACKKTKRYGQRVPIVSYYVGSLAASGSNRLIHFQKPKTKGRQIWPPPWAAKGPAKPLLCGGRLHVQLPHQSVERPPFRPLLSLWNDSANSRWADCLPFCC